MNILRFSIFTVIFLTASHSLFAQQTRSIDDRTFVRSGASWTQIDPNGLEYEVNPDVISIKFNDGVSENDKANLHPALGGVELNTAITGWVDVEISAGADVFDAIDAYMASGLVAMAEPNTIGTYTIIPDDPSYVGGQNWFITQVMSEEAWDMTTGDPSIIVAVLDSGTEFSHEDLGLGGDAYQNVWLNSGEDAWSDPNDPSTGNGVDDDLNGYVDDWKGYDFSSGNNDSSGPFFHGTSVAGVVAAKTNNATGVAGVAGGWNAQGASIMIAGVGDNAPNGSVIDDAILYAADKGAHVVQLSLSVGQSNAIDDAIQMVWDNNNMMIICSSGNGGTTTVGYPAINPNVMAIGATNQSDQRAGFSQHGPDVEISAPGVSMFTTTVGNGYSSTQGTSFSSPMVSGVIALMLSANPSLTNVEIRQILWDTADKVGGYDYNWNASMPGHSFELGYGRLNAYEAVRAAAPPLLDFYTGFEEPEE